MRQAEMAPRAQARRRRRREMSWWEELFWFAVVIVVYGLIMGRALSGG